MSSAFEGLPKTPNLKLNKPGYDNVADIEALNENADILDAEIQGIKNTFVKSVNGKEPDASGNVTVEEYTHPNSGVTAGTYRSVTVNAQGHVTAGSNPTLAIANGGTGATTASQARANLELGNMALEDNAIVNASISGTVITLTFADGTNKTLTTQDSEGIDTWYCGNSSGYVKFTNGFLIQWASTDGKNNADTTVTFAQAFTNTPVVVITRKSGADNAYENIFVWIRDIQKTYFKFYNTGGQTGIRYIAVGRWK